MYKPFYGIFLFSDNEYIKIYNFSNLLNINRLQYKSTY